MVDEIHVIQSHYRRNETQTKQTPKRQNRQKSTIILNVN